MRTKMIWLFIIFFLQLSATIINVPADQPTIQAGIYASTNLDTVLVQPGTYVENINYNGKDITVASLFLTTQDTSYISQTVIDGNQSGSVVTFESDEDSTAVLCGFTITNGYALYPGPQDAGGSGIHIFNSSPTIQNNIIENNICYWYINGCGIGIQNSSAQIMNNIIKDNDGAYYGGGIYVYQSENVLIENNEINGHLTQSGNGVAYGAGICINQSNDILIRFNLICNNEVDLGYGSGICLRNGSAELINNTISENSVYGYGTGIYLSDNSFVDIKNTILWGNNPLDFAEIYFDSYGNPNLITISYSDIQGGEAGIETNNNGSVIWQEGNIDENPLFLDVANGDFHLTVDSPCIDAGDPNSPFDPDGTIADMGAFYYDQINGIENYELQTANFKLTNYPNPFNPTTTISFSVTQNSDFVNLEIFNVKGQKVKSFQINQLSNSQVNHIVWNGDDENGKPVSSGVYLYKLNINGKTEVVRKCLLLK